MDLSDAEVEKFNVLFRADGWNLTHAEARETATRLVILYRHLARPLPTPRDTNVPSGDEPKKRAQAAR